MGRPRPYAGGTPRRQLGCFPLALLGDRRGITLLELLVAMLIMALIATMLYSVLNVGISFSRKGELRALQFGRERALLELLHRQAQGALYDRVQKKVRMVSNGSELKVVTTAPLLYREQGVVLAIYLYDAKSDTLYYTEKKDFYNPLYKDDYQAESKDMLPLIKDVGPMILDYEDDAGELAVSYRGRLYSLPARCWNTEGG